MLPSGLRQLLLNSSRVRAGIVVAILIGGLVLTLILVKKDTDNRSKAALASSICKATEIYGYELDDPLSTNEEALLQEMSKASAALRKSTNDYLASPSSDLLKEQVNQAATLRKEVLVTLMREYPQKAVTIIKQDQDNASLRTLASSDPECMEQQKTIEGELVVYFMEEMLEEEGSQVAAGEAIYSVVTSDGKEIQLYLTTPTLSGIQSRSKVKVKGYQINNNLLSDTTQNGAIEVVSQPPLPTQFDQSSLLPQFIQKTYAQSSSSSSLGVLFLLLNFSDTKRSDLSKSYLENNVVPKIKSYYNEVSYGKTTINATILEVQLSQPTFCKWMQAFRLPESPEVDKKVNYKNYSNIMIFAPFRKEGGKMCAGSAGMLGKMTLKTDEGDIPLGVMATTDSYNLSPSSISKTIAATTIHEMGHGFGMNHAAKVTCPGVIKANPSCAIEYGDDWDRMGGGKEYPGHLSAARKDKLGWWHSPSNIKTVTSNGSYTLEPYETRSSGLKVIKVPRPDGKFVYVEFRQPIGVDAAFPRGSGVFNGVLLHANYGVAYPTGGNSDVSLINPPASNNNILPPGSTFTDPETKTTIKLTGIRYGANIADTRAIVEVALGASVKPTATPTKVPTATPTKIPPTPTKSPNTPTPKLTCSPDQACAKPTLSFFLTPAYITASVISPQRVQLSWKTTNATSCTGSGGWTGVKAISGEEWTSPLTKTTTYTMTCSGPSGSITRTGTVTVEPTPTPTKKPTPTTALVTGADLIIESAVLTDASSVAKKTFKVNEPIYVRFVIKNQGAQVAKNKYETNGSIWTQVYGNRPLPVAINSRTDINVWVRNQNNIKSLQRITYASSKSRDANYAAFGAGKSFKQSTPGTYSARIFVNYDHLATESDYNNNQTIIQYTVTK